MAKISKVKETLMKDLFSSDEKLVLRSIERTKKHADATFIEPLLLVYKDGSEPIKEAVDGILSSLKVSDAEEVLVNALKDERFDAIQDNILRYLWSSGFEPAGELLTIVQVMINGDYMTTFEGFTLIDQFSTALDDDQLMQSIVELRLKLNDLGADDERYALLKTVHDHLDQIEQTQ